jgi:hypothetical protein
MNQRTLQFRGSRFLQWVGRVKIPEATVIALPGGPSGDAAADIQTGIQEFCKNNSGLSPDI